MVLNEDSVYHGGYFRVSTHTETRHLALGRVTDDMTHDTDRRQGTDVEAATRSRQWGCSPKIP